MLRRQSNYDVDRLATTIAMWAQMAKSMPPTWKHAGISQPIVGTEGQAIGRIMPGQGLYLDCDLKHIGITKHLPHVHERTVTNRILDIVRDQTGSITSFAQIQRNLKAGLGQVCSALRTLNNDAPAGQMFEFFSSATDLQTGNTQAYTSIPGGQVYDTSSQEVLNPLMMQNVGSNTTYLVSFGFNIALDGNTTPNGYGLLIVSDLLVAAGNVPTDTVVTTTVDTVALPRYTSGAGVMAMLVQVVGTTGGALSYTLTYTNQAGVSGKSTPAIGEGPDAGPSQPCTSDPSGNILPFMFLSNGDYGVRSIQTFAMSGADTAGNRLAIQLQYPLLFVAGTGVCDDYYEIDLPTSIIGLIPLQASSNGNLCALTVAGVTNGHVESGQAHLMTFKTVQG